MKFDKIERPEHYNSSGIFCGCGRQIECIDIAREKNFNIGNIFKYLWRHELKEPIDSLKKARWYLDDEIKRLEKEQEAT